jgi:hypothetical protein
MSKPKNLRANARPVPPRKHLLAKAAHEIRGAPRADHPRNRRLHEALKRAAEIRALPVLNTASDFDTAHQRFGDYKVRMNEWRVGTRLGKEYVIPTFAASLARGKTPATVSTEDVQK